MHVRCGLRWFAGGVLLGVLGGVCLFWVGMRLPGLGLGYQRAPGFEKVTLGMTYEQVVGLLGPEDGALRAEELTSYDEHRYPGLPTMNFRGIEDAGGRFLFWLSRSNGLLVFNVVVLDAKGRVVGTYDGYDTFFGKD